VNARSGTGWRAVRDEVRRRIASGKWGPGQLIPGESALAREFGCARATVNRALRELAADGLLCRKRRVGTRVAASPERRAILRIPLIREEIAALGLGYSYRLITRERRVPPEAIRAGLELPAGVAALSVQALHLGDGTPCVLEDRWVDLRTVPAIAEADLAQVSANEWLVRNVPLAEGRIAILALAADAGVAARLGCAPGSALIAIERQTQIEAGPVTVARLTYRPGHRIESTI